MQAIIDNAYLKKQMLVQKNIEYAKLTARQAINSFKHSGDIVNIYSSDILIVGAKVKSRRHCLREVRLNVCKSLIQSSFLQSHFLSAVFYTHTVLELTLNVRGVSLES